MLSRAKEQSAKDEGVGRDGLELMLDISEEALTDVRPNERTMINKVFNLAEKTAENIMTPLVDVVSISADTKREEVVKIFEEQSCSRLPVYERYVYNVIGVLEDIDMLFSAEYVPIRNLIKDSIYIPESMPLDELLITMKRKGAPMAIVVDEYGAATGIISIEDILEEVVGEIQDEFDFEPPKYRRIGHKHYLASGRMEIEKVNEKLKLEIPSGDYETLAGFLLENFEKIPKVGDLIEIDGWKYTVTKSSHKAIEEVDIRKGS
jgi:CBS domain containing-hemolysin-like protein